MKRLIIFLLLCCYVFIGKSQIAFDNYDDNKREILCEAEVFANGLDYDIDRYSIALGYEETYYSFDTLQFYYILYNLVSDKPRSIPDNSLMLIKDSNDQIHELWSHHETDILECEPFLKEGKMYWHIPVKYYLTEKHFFELAKIGIKKIRFEHPWNDTYEDFSDDGPYLRFVPGLILISQFNCIFEYRFVKKSIYDGF